MADSGLGERSGAPVPGAATAAARDGSGTATPRWLVRLRHYARSLSFTGLAGGWLLFIVSLTPSLLPRSWQAQGFVSGFALAQGYGLGVVAAWAARHLRIRWPGQRARRQAWHVLGVVALVTMPAMVVLSSLWERRIRDAVGVPGTGPLLYLGVLGIAAGVAAGLVGLARLVHDLYLAVAERLRRHLPPLLARLAATAVVLTLSIGGATGFTDQVLLRVADLTFSAANNGNAPGVTRPLSPLRSGSAASLVSWDSLGLQGRAFVAGGPDAAAIARFTGRPAQEPVRVYAGARSAATLQDEANLVLRELKRTGAFGRALLALGMPTGRGSVYSTLADPLEYMYGGDTAIASLQYSYWPSWISFLAQRPRAREAGRVLFGTVYRYWATLPPDHRPKLVVFGESLGAYGAEGGFTSLADLTRRTSGALFSGPPNGSVLWRQLTAARDPGSPEWQPVYGDGGTVRFISSAAGLRLPGGALRHPKVVYLQHPSDPVVWWSPSLAWQKPDWLAEPRAPGVTSQMQWYPLVTFWQITADLVVSTAASGYGHHYAAEIPTAWAAILHPPGWTAADTARLTADAADRTLP